MMIPYNSYIKGSVKVIHGFVFTFFICLSGIPLTFTIVLYDSFFFCNLVVFYDFIFDFIVFYDFLQFSFTICCTIVSFYDSVISISVAGCKSMCKSEKEPVCGTNRITYTNKCHLKNARCNKPSIQLLHNGKCRSVKPQHVHGAFGSVDKGMPK